MGIHKNFLNNSKVSQKIRAKIYNWESFCIPKETLKGVKK
jgi:hypothetical protein